MTDAPVRYERTGAAALVTIDRPQRRNAVDAATAELLRQSLERFEADDGRAGDGADGRRRRRVLRGRRPEGDGPRDRASTGADGVHARDAVQAHDRRDQRLVPGRRARDRPVVRPADRDRGLDVRPVRAALGSPADRRRHAAPAARRGDGPRARADPHRAGPCRPTRRCGSAWRTRSSRRAATSSGRWSWRSSWPGSPRRRCSPTGARRSRAPACRCGRACELEHEIGREVLDVAARGAARFAGGEGRGGTGV